MRPLGGSSAWRIDTASSCGKLHILPSRLGRIVRNIRRKIERQEALENAFALRLSGATQIRSQQQRQRGWKQCSFQAPEVECIGKDKASSGKASIVTNNRRSPGGLFVLHARAKPTPRMTVAPYGTSSTTSSHSPAARSSGPMSKRDTAGMRAEPASCLHLVEEARRLRCLKRELRRRSAVEPIIGYLKADGHLRPLLPQRLRRRCG